MRAPGAIAVVTGGSGPSAPAPEPSRVGRIALAGGLVACLSLTAAAPVQAASPGENGAIAFFCLNAAATAEIYTMNADGTGQFNQTRDPETRDGNPAFSPDGARIAFDRAPVSTDPVPREIFVMNADGSGKTNLTNDPAGDSQPAFSPDGRRIAFVRNAEIWVMNADGSAQTRLTTNPEGDVSPTWSPDGMRIAFVRIAEPFFTGDIHAVNPDGSGQANLTNTPELGEDAPDFSPDGARITFVRPEDPDFGEDTEVYVMNADGSAQTVLTDNVERDFDPAFSPDGTRIAFVRQSTTTRRNQVFTMNANGSNELNVSNSPAIDSGPSWAPRPRPTVTQPTPVVRDSRAPAVRVAAARRACAASSFRARVTVDEPVQSVLVRLDGRRILRTTRAAFTVRLRVRRLRRGTHRLTVVATDAAGNTGRRTLRFRVCAAQVPRFTG